MGFTFHKLYPMLYPVAALNCCDLTSAELRTLCRYEDPNNCPPCETPPCGIGVLKCQCPGPPDQPPWGSTYYGTGSCSTVGGELPVGSCNTCSVFKCSTLSSLCSLIGERSCETTVIYYNHCPLAGGWCLTNECCPFTIPGTCVYWDWLFGEFGWTDSVASVANFSNCIIEGADPKTYRVENIGVDADLFICTAGVTSVRYEPIIDPNTNNPLADGYVRGDPALTSPRPFRQRFYKDLNNSTHPSGITGASASYNTYCLKLHSTPSQAEGIENRVMFIAGRNIYRYTGPLSGDPQLSSYGAASDPFWNSGGMTGVTGIKQWEESISGRTFPLPDTTMILPLWGQSGQSGSNNLGLNFGVGSSETECANPYWDFYYNGSDPEQGDGIPVCASCRCIRTSANDATGHYLSTEHFGSSSGRGYTAGYFSFASFNPHCYLDHIWDASENGAFSGRDTQAINPLYDTYNLLSGLSGGASYFADLGVSGATCHGERLGVPACSLWSLTKALYSRVLHAVQRNVIVNGYQTNPYSESTFRDVASPTGFKPFVDALDAMLADNPSELTAGGTSKVQYHLARVSNELEICSGRFFTDTSNGFAPLGKGYGDRLRFTFPNVFLWDRNAFIAASGADKWKHLYVVGNGNIIHDSGSVAIEQPYNLDWENVVFQPSESGLSADILNQDYKSAVFYLNRFNHQLGPIGGIGATSHHARMLVFNGSGGPTGVGEFTRRNAKSKISLTSLPVCDSLTLDSYEYTPCSLCNAHPNLPPCTPARESTNQCDVINVFPPPGASANEANHIEYVMCVDLGGLNNEFNSLTASYQI